MRPALPLPRPTLTLSRSVQWQAWKGVARKQCKRIAPGAGLLLCLLWWMAGCQKSAPLQDPPPTATPVERQAVAPVVTSQPQEATCQRGSLDAAKEVVLGALLPLSSPGAVQVGLAMQAAIKLAVEDVNTGAEFRGKLLRVAIYDTSGLPEQGVRFANRLIRQDCVAVLVGLHQSDVALAVKKVAHQAGIPIIFVDPRADEITADPLPEVFRVGASTSMLIQAPAKWLVEVGDYNGDQAKVVAFVAENSLAGKDRVDLVKQWWPGYGFDLETMLVDLPTTDFSPIIARIVAHEHLPDAIFISMPSNAAFGLQRQLLDAGIGPQKKTLLINNGSLTDNENFWQQIPDGVYTIAWRIGPWPSTATELGRHFAEAYSRTFNRWPEGYAFEAYDTVQLAADAIMRANSLQSNQIISALETTNLELASGHYTFPYGSKNHPDDERVPAYMWHQWPDSLMLFLQYGAAGQKANDAEVIWPKAYRTINAPLLPELKQAP
ncbi:MAG: ABC transporter substrate-binding protein [Caldilineaceae bacterium]